MSHLPSFYLLIPCLIPLHAKKPIIQNLILLGNNSTGSVYLLLPFLEYGEIINKQVRNS